MKEEENISFEIHENDSIDNIDIIKETVKQLHSKKRDDVPVYLDELKKKKSIKDATYDNDFLKYML